MNDTTILMILALMIALILGLTFLRLWYTIITTSKLHQNLLSLKAQIGQVRSMTKAKVDIKNDLGNMDITQLAQMFGIDKEILDNPIVQGFLEGVMQPKDQKQGEGLSR